MYAESKQGSLCTYLQDHHYFNILLVTETSDFGQSDAATCHNSENKHKETASSRMFQLSVWNKKNMAFVREMLA